MYEKRRYSVFQTCKVVNFNSGQFVVYQLSYDRLYMKNAVTAYSNLVK